MADNYYWLISAPKTPQDTYQTVVRNTSKAHAYATCYKFEVPELKVGTLDSLMMLSDDLARIDLFVENTTKKIVRQLGDIDKKPEKNEMLTVNNSMFYATFYLYVVRFGHIACIVLWCHNYGACIGGLM